MREPGNKNRPRHKNRRLVVTFVNRNALAKSSFAIVRLQRTRAYDLSAPRIRGQLRWWFWVLGVTPRDESVIFGTVAADEGCASPALIVRVADFKCGPVWKPPTINQNTPENYVWHYASVFGTHCARHILQLREHFAGLQFVVLI